MAHWFYSLVNITSSVSFMSLFFLRMCRCVLPTDGSVLHPLQPPASPHGPGAAHGSQPLLQAAQLQDGSRVCTTSARAGAEARSRTAGKLGVLCLLLHMMIITASFIVYLLAHTSSLNLILILFISLRHARSWRLVRRPRQMPTSWTMTPTIHLTCALPLSFPCIAGAQWRSAPSLEPVTALHTRARCAESHRYVGKPNKTLLCEK